MSSESPQSSKPSLDLAKYANLPNQLIVGGAVGLLIGFFAWREQFLYSYLTAFMFFLSLVLGGLFLVLLHHLFDSQWLVPIRRICEHFAGLAPILGVLGLPVILIFAKSIYPWMAIEDPHSDHALHVKYALFNPTAFWVVSIALFVVWTWLANRLRKHSLAQDETGAATHTQAMRKYAAGGIVLFAFTLTLGVIYWMKSLEHQWFSTMYGVYYFAGSVWTTLATMYVLTALLQRTGHLAPVVRDSTFKDIGTLFFAFTVFYAYIHFSQYFLIWNAAIPEETFWYVKRENGIWWYLGMLIIFGHFFVPFLTMLRIDVKKKLTIMAPLAGWAWLMHYVDMTFNIKPVIDPEGHGISLSGMIQSIASMAFIGGFLAKFFLKSFITHAPFPQRDPRIAETMGVYVELESEAQAQTKSAKA